MSDDHYRSGTPAPRPMSLKEIFQAIDNAGKTPYLVAKPEARVILWKAIMNKPLK